MIAKMREYSLGAFYVVVASIVTGVAMMFVPALVAFASCFPRGYNTNLTRNWIHLGNFWVHSYRAHSRRFPRSKTTLNTPSQVHLTWLFI